MSALAISTRRRGLGQDSIASALASAGRRSVRRVVFRSTISPDIELDPNQESPRQVPQAQSPYEGMLRIIKPAVYVDIGGSMVKYAPWGEPEENYFPLLAGAAALATIVGVALVVRGIRR